MYRGWCSLPPWLRSDWHFAATLGGRVRFLSARSTRHPEHAPIPRINRQHKLNFIGRDMANLRVRYIWSKYITRSSPRINKIVLKNSKTPENIPVYSCVTSRAHMQKHTCWMRSQSQLSALILHLAGDKLPTWLPTAVYGILARLEGSKASCL